MCGLLANLHPSGITIRPPGCIMLPHFGRRSSPVLSRCGRHWTPGDVPWYLAPRCQRMLYVLSVVKTVAMDRNPLSNIPQDYRHRIAQVRVDLREHVASKPAYPTCTCATFHFYFPDLKIEAFHRVLVGQIAACASKRRVKCGKDGERRDADPDHRNRTPSPDP